MNRVLIVDDMPEVLTVTGDMVKKLGFVPILAKDAREALMIFRKEKPGLVITDLNLGGEMDGISLCSKIRFEDHLVCVIAMTGFLNQYDLEFCIAAGFADVLVKPIDLDDLASSIKCNMDRRTRWVANGRPR